ncbi:MAG: C69 family dipeptidase [Lachnospiraceae bacterium]|nr:C69 family dipeptidase [Lachnospiraceae bacterium]
MTFGNRIRKGTRLCAALAVAAVVLFQSFVTVNACTAVYVGKKASADGTIIMARCNDIQAVCGNYIKLTERVENAPGRSLPVNSAQTVWAPLPATTYRFTATPFMDSSKGVIGFVKDSAICTNEYGVLMTMSVSAYANEAAETADPYVETGLTEDTATDLVVCQSKTAREAVKVLLSLIDEYGSSECNIAMIADQKEAWYVEMYTGHQYCAVKLPEDMASVFGNEFNLEYREDYPENISSKELESLAVKNDFAVYDKNKRLNLFDTYAGVSIRKDSCHQRTWIGHNLLSKDFQADYKFEDTYPLCFKPDNKVSVNDVMSIMRNRYEGTKYSPDETGAIDSRVIGTDISLSVHVGQIYPEVPAEMSCVTWLTTGPAIYSVFVPVSNASLSVSKAYGANQPLQNAGLFEDTVYPYYTFKEINTLCVERDCYQVYGAPVKEYWGKAEKGMTEGFAKVLSEAAAMKDQKEAQAAITDYCNRMQSLAFDDALHILNDVKWSTSQNSNTIKAAKDPETGKYLKTEKVLDPIDLSKDASLDVGKYIYQSK